MSFIFITGAPGAGKSTLKQKLADLKYEVYDLDDSRFGGPYNKASGKKVIIPPADEREEDWFDYHEWRIYRFAFEELKSKAADKTIIVCGVAEADNEISDLFDHILYLSIDDETLTNRISSRIDNDYGKNTSELEDIINRKHKLDAKYLNQTYEIIDASGSTDETISNIIKQI